MVHALADTVTRVTPLAAYNQAATSFRQAAILDVSSAPLGRNLLGHGPAKNAQQELSRDHQVRVRA